MTGTRTTAPNASFYVHRFGSRTDVISGNEIPTQGWVGPIGNLTQAEREADAWRAAGWSATVHPNTAEVTAQVDAWQDEAIDCWKDSTDPTQRRQWHEREESRRLRRSA